MEGLLNIGNKYLGAKYRDHIYNPVSKLVSANTSTRIVIKPICGFISQNIKKKKINKKHKIKIAKMSQSLITFYMIVLGLFCLHLE